MSPQSPWLDPPSPTPAQPQLAQSSRTVPGGARGHPKTRLSLSWIIGGSVAAAAAFVVLLVLVLSALLAPPTQPKSVSATREAVFSYPASWVQTQQNVTVVKSDGNSPTERFVVENADRDSTALAVYEGSAKPRGVVTREKIHERIDTGLRGQLAASQAQLVYLRGTSGFGCLARFAYTRPPAIVDRDGLYGFSYGYTCVSAEGPIDGEYLVGIDTTGVSHRLTVEATATEWAAHKAALEAIVPSLKPLA
ncbi:hypothetical protein AL755_01410 (plasmid) [Arthrobacter sp. ERGS1:01]|uniref:hypothetical protein n=1 Tax=Arthrobacter sp. ERGS1:01 TaxID=1704044 RepID=UPI0006B5E63C|nr:hypothetical protein [Arthrobacter sp. ERGS1:01]ALE04381.1 hypothetical protein AL755_01410 [Arthrobacter sp. ERGS1:01]